MDGGNKIPTEADVSDTNGVGSHLEKVIPMRFFGTILEKYDDGTISFRWAKDTRNLQEYQNTLNEHYADQEPDASVKIAEETTYVIRLDDNHYRCQLSAFSMLSEKTVHLIDYGKSFKIGRDNADFFYFDHEESWNDEHCFAFAGICRIADKNQCLQLGIPLSDEFVPGEEVEIFLLSPDEPYYAVISSLRNPEAKLLETTLTCDLSPDFAKAWNEVTANRLELIPAERPTLSLSPKWIHGSNPVLVTIPYIEALDKVAVCDLLCSLRTCILSEYLRENYEKPNVRQSLCISDPMNQIGVGVIVVALDPSSNRYYRARICEINASFTLIDLVGIDYPQWKSFNHPLYNIWLLSKTLEIVPRMHHYVPLLRNVKANIKLLYTELAASRCGPNSVVYLKHNDDTLEPEIIIPDDNFKHFKLTDLLPAQNDVTSLTRSPSMLSLNSTKSKKSSVTYYNKSKIPVPTFKDSVKRKV